MSELIAKIASYQNLEQYREQTRLLSASLTTS